MKNKTIFLSTAANMLAGGMFFLLLLIAVEPAYKNTLGNALALSSLLVTLTQVGRLLSSSIAAAFSRSKQPLGLFCAFLSLGLAFFLLYLSIHMKLPMLILVSAIFMGLGHSLSNIELRTIATTSTPAVSLSEFTVYSFIGWFLGLSAVGAFSARFSFETISLLAAIVPAPLMVIISKTRHTAADPGDKGLSLINLSGLTKIDRGNMFWIWMGAFLNSLQVTLFNASIVVFIKANLSLSNIGLSLVLAPVFFAGLFLLPARVRKQFEPIPNKSLWQSVQGFRLLSTLIVLTTTSLWVALAALPFFGLLMNMGAICQLRAAREMLGKEHQKITHSVMEIAVVAGGFAVTMLNFTGLSTRGLISLIALMIAAWFIVPKLGGGFKDLRLEKTDMGS